MAIRLNGIFKDNMVFQWGAELRVFGNSDKPCTIRCELFKEEFEEPAPAQEEENLSVRRKEEDLIRQALEKYHGNRKKAAEELGMSERTLYRKLPAEYRKK